MGLIQEAGEEILLDKPEPQRTSAIPGTVDIGTNKV